ncbi:similar to lipase [Plenodomus lingam JN3]|uniref:Similar to lipase n=1 Tax=Leptosphaeria maculans (strain JN3 / isolate v23.1.3 / race Av1-4-5-6-7-8) TaxID=985895 RepID=E4ZT40_LEPMJ|nr:similar to lipase [Plenodomus lingam JN3]CBX94471.1 similar to lipase [Plenodomus lingam JN3]
MVALTSVFHTIVFAAVCSNAAPLVEKRDVQADVFDRAKLMAQYAAAAYCPSNFGSPGDQLNCPSGGCRAVEDADASSVIEYSRSETPTDVTGFVAVDHSNKLIVVSFRGSSTIDSWLTNLNLEMTPTDICPDCSAHRGFWNSWTDARDRVLPAVKQAGTTYPTYQIVVTGHSLGAAIATFAAAQLRNSGYTVALYNYGSPRIGGTKICQYITDQPGGNYRFTHWNDPVPKLPLLIMGYKHISPEYYIEKRNGEDVQPSDIKVFQGLVNLRGNSAWIAVDVEAHRWYFGRMYTCDAKRSSRGLQIRDVEEGIDVLATF